MTPHWTNPEKYNLSYVELPPSDSAIGGGYEFIGPDCVFAGGPSGSIQLAAEQEQPTSALLIAGHAKHGPSDSTLSWHTDNGRTANVMLYSKDGESGALIGQTSADATVTIAPKASSTSEFERELGAAWNAAGASEGGEERGGRVEGRVGEVRWFRHASDGRVAVQVEALEGEVFTIHPSSY